MEKPIGFILLNEYPGSKPAGFFEPYTTGEFVKYPNFWWPVPPFLEFFGQKIAGESIIEMARAVIIEYKKPSFSMLNNPLAKQWKDVVKGFRLVKEYPGSPQIGSFEPYTTGEYLKFQKYWKVEYKDAKSDGLTQQEKFWRGGLEEFIHEESNNLFSFCQKLVAEKEKLKEAAKSQSPVEKTTMQKIEEIREGGQSPEILNEVSLVILHDKIVLKSLDKSVLLEKELKGFTAQPWSVLISWVGHLRQGLKPEEAFHLAVDKVMAASSEVRKDEEKKLAPLKEIIAIARCILEEANSVSSRPFRMNRLKGQCDRIEFLANTDPIDKKALAEEPAVATYTITRTKDADGKTYLKRVCDGFNPLELLGLLELTQLDIQKQMKGEVQPDVIERQFIKP